MSGIRGIIYMISSPNTDKVYIGKTIKTLSLRFRGHNSNHSLCRSSIIIEAGDSKITELLVMENSSKIDLAIKELEFIKKYEHIAVNAEVFDIEKEPKENKDSKLMCKIKEKKKENKIIKEMKKEIKKEKKKNLEERDNLIEQDFIKWYDFNVEKCSGEKLNRPESYRNYILNSEYKVSKQIFFKLMSDNTGEPYKYQGEFCYKNYRLSNSR